MACELANSGCNYPQSECDGGCAEKVASRTNGANKAALIPEPGIDLHAILHVTPTGEFNWHKDADRLIEEGDFRALPSMQHILRRLRAYEKLAKQQGMLKLRVVENPGAVAVGTHP